MHKKVRLFFPILFLLLFPACASSSDSSQGFETPYPLKLGTYGFKKAILTHVLTKETEEKTLADIVSSSQDAQKWNFLTDFSVTIKADTEFIYTKDNRCVVIKDGFAFDLVAENTFQIYFPYRSPYSDSYDIVVVLGWMQRYS